MQELSFVFLVTETIKGALVAQTPSNVQLLGAGRRAGILKAGVRQGKKS